LEIPTSTITKRDIEMEFDWTGDDWMANGVHDLNRARFQHRLKCSRGLVFDHPFTIDSHPILFGWDLPIIVDFDHHFDLSFRRFHNDSQAQYRASSLVAGSVSHLILALKFSLARAL